jgi:hypothetical protein
MENIVNINYAQTGKATSTNSLGMREMQAKAYEARSVNRNQKYSENGNPTTVNMGTKLQ